ncbi:MAG: RNA 2'-phosphotransferase [Deltaproteobacteria bacterium]|nr:RNA 2'-phosphotransferase [Deltaproteobacteria bacterium]
MSNVTSSKFLSLVLRHQPALIGITLDDAGWTDVTALLAACARHGKHISRTQLEGLVADSDKQRFALSPDGSQIRANQGHSVDVDLKLDPATPPPTLFHGTFRGAIAGIRELGLLKGERHHVHLSADLATAKKVGGRRGVPIILLVRAGEMATAGHTFFCTANGVWLVEMVPTAFIEFPPA